MPMGKGIFKAISLYFQGQEAKQHDDLAVNSYRLSAKQGNKGAIRALKALNVEFDDESYEGNPTYPCGGVCDDEGIAYNVHFY